MFCPKCGSILLPKSIGGKIITQCSCGYSGGEGSGKITETVRQASKREERKFEAIGPEKSRLPLTDVECPKCHHGQAHYWTRQTRAGDEGETKFHQCAKCKHTWRDYG